MPEKYCEVTIRIVSAPYVSGSDAYMDVQMWGNPQKWTYRMKLGKTLWFSIYKYLQEMDNSRFSAELEPSVLQENLEFLNGRIITIQANNDINVSFKTKDGKLDYGKKFSAKFRGDLEEAERLGGEFYKKAFFETVLDNSEGAACININSKLAKLTIQLAKEKEEEKKLKQEDKKKAKEEKQKQKQPEVEWVKKRREKEEKEAKLQTKLGNAGW